MNELDNLPLYSLIDLSDIADDEQMYNSTMDKMPTIMTLDVSDNVKALERYTTSAVHDINVIIKNCISFNLGSDSVYDFISELMAQQFSRASIASKWDVSKMNATQIASLLQSIEECYTTTAMQIYSEILNKLYEHNVPLFEDALPYTIGDLSETNHVLVFTKNSFRQMHATLLLSGA